jgi:glycerol-3-phosphate dehydrogenase
VLLCEQGDLASATSSASTKLFHGGLRYLEFYEFLLVRKALIEREVLLRAMPHISWPLRFVLPHHKGLRPAWLLRLGLFIYDHLGGRKILPPTRTVDLTSGPLGAPLKAGFRKGFEYSDCWVEDARLVVLNARDAAARGAEILTRTRCHAATRQDGLWHVELRDVETGATRTIRARALINAGGPWVEEIIRGRVRENTSEIIRGRVRENTSDKIRLVRGSHIVTRKLFDHDQPYIFQQSDGRIIFAIPYETDFTLIGTTDHDHEGDPGDAVCTPEEVTYLCKAASEYFATPITEEDVVWTYSGVRPLYDDGATLWRQDHHLPQTGRGCAGETCAVFSGARRKVDRGRPPARWRFSGRRGGRSDRPAASELPVPGCRFRAASGARLRHPSGRNAGGCRQYGRSGAVLRLEPDRARGALADDP